MNSRWYNNNNNNNDNNNSNNIVLKTSFVAWPKCFIFKGSPRQCLIRRTRRDIVLSDCVHLPVDGRWIRPTTTVLVQWSVPSTRRQWRPTGSFARPSRTRSATCVGSEFPWPGEWFWRRKTSTGSSRISTAANPGWRLNRVYDGINNNNNIVKIPTKKKII